MRGEEEVMDEAKQCQNYEKFQFVAMGAQYGERKRTALSSGNGSKCPRADRYSNQCQRRASCVSSLTAKRVSKSHLLQSRAPAQSKVAPGPHTFVLPCGIFSARR